MGWWSSSGAEIGTGIALLDIDAGSADATGRDVIRAYPAFAMRTSQLITLEAVCKWCTDATVTTAKDTRAHEGEQQLFVDCHQ